MVVAPGRMIDSFQSIPDAESLPLYRMVLKLACVCGRPNRLRPPLLREPRIQMLPSDLLGVGADAHTVHKERNWVDRVTDLRGGRRMSQECCWTWRQQSRSTAAELDGYCVEGQYRGGADGVRVGPGCF